MLRTLFAVLMLSPVLCLGEKNPVVWDPTAVRTQRYALGVDVGNTEGILDPSIESVSLRYRFVLSHGFFGERNPCAHGIALVNSTHYTRGALSQLSLVHPDSTLSFEANVAIFASGYRKVAEALKPGEKMVAIIHSWGAPIFTQMLQENPDLLPHFQAFYFIQGAFGGTPIASHHLGKPSHRKTDKEMLFWRRTFFELGAKVEHVFGGRYRRAVESLTPESMVPRMREVFGRMRQTRVWDSSVGRETTVWDAFDRRAFYIVTADDPFHTRWLKPPHEYLDTYFGTSDGLILVNDQYPNEGLFPEWSRRDNGQDVYLWKPTRKGFEMESFPAPVLGRVVIAAYGVDHRDLVVDHSPIVDSPRGLRRAAWQDILTHLTHLENRRGSQ